MPRIRYFFYFFCLIKLTGCVNYTGIHGHSKLLDVSALSTTYVYRPPNAAKFVYSHWWSRFHDPYLHRLITIALSDSPNLQMAEARVRKAQYLAQGAGANLWPTVTASGEVYRARFSSFGLVPPPFNGHTFNIGDLNLNFNYEFDWWGRNRQILASKLSKTGAAEADLAEARLILSTLTASIYFQLHNNIAQLSIARRILQQHQEMLAIITSRSKRGIDSDIPVAQVSAETQSTKITVARLSQTQSLLYHQLAVLLGKNPFMTKISMSKFNYRAQRIALPRELPANLLAQRPDIIASRLRAEAAANMINVAKTRFFPNINLIGLLGYQGVGLNHVLQSSSRNTSYGAAIDLPIFDAGTRRANLAVKYAEYDLAVNAYNQTILMALREVADRLSSLHMLTAQQRAQNGALNATQKKYYLTNLRYQHGIADYTQVLYVKGLLLQRQAQQVELQTQHLQVIVAMIKALGGNELMSKPNYDGHAS
jgi:NodT family efflux transporter outer membrane factor (OMF) lipoprotein